MPRVCHCLGQCQCGAAEDEPPAGLVVLHLTTVCQPRVDAAANPAGRSGNTRGLPRKNALGVLIIIAAAHCSSRVSKLLLVFSEVTMTVCQMRTSADGLLILQL
jgi:hypothetical protein